MMLYSSDDSEKAGVVPVSSQGQSRRGHEGPGPQLTLHRRGLGRLGHPLDLGQEADLDGAPAQRGQGVQGGEEVVDVLAAEGHSGERRDVLVGGAGELQALDGLEVALEREDAEEGLAEGHGARLADDAAAADHAEELEHALVHAGALEGEGHHGGEARVALGRRRARPRQRLLDRLDGRHAVRQRLAAVVGAAHQREVRGGEAQHGVDEEVELAAVSEAVGRGRVEEKGGKGGAARGGR